MPQPQTITADQILDTVLPVMLWQDAPLTPLDWLTLLFLVVLLVAMVLVVGSRVVPLWRTAKRLDRLVSELGERYPSLVRSVTIWEEEISPTVSRLEEMRGPWREFNEACFDLKGELRNAHQSQDYFRADLLEPRSMGFIRHVPALMTSAGILGTFIGIAVGLSQMHLDVATAKLMQVEMHKLITALAVSFRTSIWGLFGAIVMTMVVSTLERRLEGAVSRFVQWLDATIKRGTQHDLLIGMTDLQQQQVDAVNGLSHDLLKGFEEMLNGKDGAGGIVGAVNMMQQNIQEAQTQGVDQMVGNFLDKLNEGMGDQFDSLGESMQQMATANSTYQDAMGAVVANLEEATDKQRESVGQMTTASEGAMTAVTQIADTLATLSGSIGDVQQAMTAQSAQVERQNSVAQEVLAVAQLQNQGWQQHQDAIQQAYNGIQNRFDSLGQSVTDLVKWHHAIKTELTQLVDSFSAAISEQHALTTTLGSERTAFEEVLDRVGLLSDATQAMETTSASVAEAVSSLARASQAFENTQGSLTSATSALLKEDRDARSQWSLVQDELQTTAHQLVEGASAFQTEANRGLESALSSFDKQLSSAVGALGQAIFSLQEQVEALGDLADNLNRASPPERPRT